MNINFKISSNQLFKTCMTILFLASGISSIAQDKIVKKGGETLEVKILEISPSEIKYKLLSDLEGPIFIMDKDRISEVQYQDGRIEKYLKPLNDAEFYIDQKKRAIKLNFLSPLLGYTQVAYEKNLKPGRSYEISLGIIGLGKNQQVSGWNTEDYKADQRGVFGSFGYKFIKVPDFTANNQKYGHIMQGLYVKPEFMAGYLSRNISIDNNLFNNGKIEKRSTAFGALLINLGKQWVFSDIFIIDLYGGIGYALHNGNDSEFDYDGRLYGIVAGNNDASVAFSGGFRIGLLLK